MTLRTALLEQRGVRPNAGDVCTVDATHHCNPAYRYADCMGQAYTFDDGILHRGGVYWYSSLDRLAGTINLIEQENT